MDLNVVEHELAIDGNRANPLKVEAEKVVDVDSLTPVLLFE